MNAFTQQFRRIWIQLPRYRWVLIWTIISSGFGVAALERWRPDLVRPYQHPLFVGLSYYLDPIRAGSRKTQKSTERVLGLWETQSDYERMKSEVVRMEAELQAAREEVRRLGRVSGLRQWRSSANLEFLPADVVGFSTDDRNAILTINRGSRDKLEPGLPVVGQKGLAGVIREVSERSALVQAITDPLSAVGVADVQTRHRGVVFGRGRDAEAEFIPENEVQPINTGAVLITSGFGNSIYPKGLIVGTIREKRTNPRGLVYGVIEPAENFNALEEVLVIRPSEQSGIPDGGSLGTLSVEMGTTKTVTKAAEPEAPVPASPKDTDFTKALDSFSQHLAGEMAIMELRKTSPTLAVPVTPPGGNHP
ncbi:rod shape-determining protein MreC [Candidatus Sumerlaeota bacterium]|nr:rod shape-determining protein MreC [Candidatus Sumerlaeota bacterium]